MKRIELAGYQAKHFQYTVAGKVATITLNRPDRKNPLTFDSYGELRDLFREMVYATDIKTVVFTGSGGNFCSGGDVHEIIGPLVRMQEADDMPGLLDFTRMTGDLVKAIVFTGSGGNFCSGGDVHEIIGPLTGMRMPELLEFTRMTGALVKAMRDCPQPVIAAIDGICAGAGAMIALAADLRLGTPAAKTAFLFTRVGLAGADMGACGLLPRVIGQGRATELLLNGRAMSADEGLAWGFFNALHARDELLTAAQAQARALADGPWFAHTITKTMLNQEWAMGIEEMIESEAQAQALCMLTQDFHRAYHAFVAKQKPVFQGD